jgi:Concanavalin A-like lectin/glucanases superfamily/Viral BACON domain
MNKARFSICVLLFFIAFDKAYSATPSLVTVSDAAPIISRSPAALSASTLEGLNALAQTFKVWNSGQGTLDYSISVDQNWLSCFPANGTSSGEHDSITVSYSTDYLTTGTYSATITIRAAAGHSPQTIHVSLKVTRFPQASLALNFDEGDGAIAYDASGNNNHGILYGGVSYTDDGAVGSYALSFDGVDDHVVCPGNSTLRPDNISVSLWVKQAKGKSYPKYGGILQGAYGGGYSDGFRVMDYRNSPLAQINFGDAEPVGIRGTAFTIDEWTHLVVTYDHTMLRLYQNGQLIVERPETRNIHWASSAGNLSIGRAVEWYFSGLIDGVMIFSSALTSQMVQQLYAESGESSRGHPGPIQPRLPLENPQRRLRESPQSPPSLFKSGLSRSPDILSASVMKGRNANAQTFNVWNSAGASLSYSIGTDQGWLSCFPASGTSTGEHDSITVSYSTASLSLGTHSATITVSGTAAYGSPQTIPVNLRVTSFPEITELNFDEGEGKTALDSSGNNNNGILEGGVVYTKDHATGSYALSFDGINDRLVGRPNLSFRPDDITVALWVKHAKDTSFPNYGGILQGAYGDGYSDGLRIVDYQNKPLAQINFGDAEPVWILGLPFALNEWTQLVLTYDHAKIRLYQNGQLVAQKSETRNINWASSASDLIVGLAELYFKGLIDKVMICSSALTVQQVQQLYVDR